MTLGYWYARLAIFAGTVLLLLQSAMAAETFAYKGFSPGQMTYEEFRLKENPQDDNDFLSAPRPIRCGPAEAGTGTIFCAESSGDFLSWTFLDGILASVYTTIPRSDFETVLKLFSEKYGSSYVVAAENLHDEYGHSIEGFHTYTWTKDGRQIKLWEYWRSFERSLIDVSDLKLTETYESRLNHVAI